MFLVANKVEEDRQVSVVLTVIGPKNYALLHDLLAQDKPTSKSVDVILETLQKHYEPRRVVIAERL